MPVELSYFQAVVLGVVEGLTEFLPISSTGHLTIAEQLLGLPVDDPAVTAYTAVIQIGAIVATFIYFAGKIARLFRAWVGGLTSAQGREDKDYTLAWAVIVGSLPVGIVGFLARDLISGALRSLWVVATALILWSAVIWVAEQRHDVLEKRGIQRGEHDITVIDGLVIGLVQVFSLIPGVSRSGATISAGLMRGINRVTATELSFFMAIPALTAAGRLRGGQGQGRPRRARRRARCCSASSWRSARPTPRSPGCCASSRATRCGPSSGTGSPSAWPSSWPSPPGGSPPPDRRPGQSQPLRLNARYSPPHTTAIRARTTK